MGEVSAENVDRDSQMAHGETHSGRRGHTVIHTRTHERPFTGTFLASLDTEARDRERESDGTESHRSSEAADSVVGGVRRSLDARRHEARDHQGRFTTGGIAMAGLAADALGAR